MNKITLWALAFILIIGLLNGVNAMIDAKIDVKEMFSESDLVYFSYHISSDEDVTIRYYPYIYCPEMPQAFINEQEAQLRANIPITLNYTSFSVSSDTNPQSCTASLSITSPEIITVKNNFSLDVLPKIPMEISLCKDVSCSHVSRLFKINEELFIQLETTIADPAISATLTYPDTTESKINLPAHIILKDSGNYRLTVSIEKEGFRDSVLSKEFEVVEEYRQPTAVSTCNGNSVCEDGENYQNCPRDCPSGSMDGYCDKVPDGTCDTDCDEGDSDCKGSSWIIIALLILLLCLLIVGLIIFVRKNKRGINSYEQ